MLFESLKYDCVRSFLQQLVTKDKYKNLPVPDEFKDLYYMEGKYAFLLGIDALVKFEQIVGDMSLIDEYVSQLERVFKKLDDSDDIRRSIYLIIIKIVSVKLSITNINTESSRERILYYIYNNYIVNGYFYFGCLSNCINELSYIGICKDGFLFDNNIDGINNIFKKYCNRTLFNYEYTSITDNIIIALYYAFISPNYLSSMIVNPLMKKYNKECFYTKDIMEIKGVFESLCNSIHLNNDDMKDAVNMFVSSYISAHSNDTHPCIVKIRRSIIGKNKLRDIDEIIHNYDEDLLSSVEIILDNRYNSFSLTSDISSEYISVSSLPTYNDFVIGKNSFIMINDDVTIDKEELEYNDSIITSNTKVNSYGAVSLAIIGLLFIIVGMVIPFVFYWIGG